MATYEAQARVGTQLAASVLSLTLTLTLTLTLALALTLTLTLTCRPPSTCYRSTG